MVLRCYSRRNLLPAFSKQRLVVGHHHDLPSAPLLSRLAAVQVRRHMTQHSAPLSPSATHSSPSPPSPQPQPLPQSARLSSAPSTPSHSRQPAQSTPSPSRPRSRPAANHHEPWSFFSPRAAAWRSPTSPGAPKHPLVRKLLTELYSTHRPVAANRVWRAYNAVREASIPRVGSSTETASLMDQLEPVHHQLVLRAIDPHVARARRLHRLTAKRRRLEATSDQDASPAPSTSTSTSATPALAPDASMPSSFPDHAPSAAAHDASVAFFDSFNRKMLAQAAAKISSKSVFDATYSVREYMHRVNVIFREMRHLSRAASSPEQQQLPTLSDYNHVLSRLALGGHIGVMANLWNELTGVSAKRNASAAAVEQPLVPNRATYRELMVGLTKHASDQTERVQKAEASAAVKTKRSLEKSARAAAGGLAKYGQILAPSARGAAILAALRTMALLKDMRDHDVQPNQLTRDLAARTLRLAGHLDGLNMLMKQAYGIDLTAPGSTAAAGSDRDFPRPTVHTLNTVLMTLGEQATVPEMIAAYETIVRPTPAPGADGDAMEGSSAAAADDDGQKGLFATNWKDLIRSVRERGSEEQGSDAAPAGDGHGGASTVMATASSVADPHGGAASAGRLHPYALEPSVKTFDVLIQHCCVELDPLRSPAVWPQSAVGAGRTMSDLVKEATATTVAELSDGGPRAAEMAKRSQGDYMIFARYLIDEALDLTQRHTEETAKQLGMAIVERSPDADAGLDPDAGTTAQDGGDVAAEAPAPTTATTVEDAALGGQGEAWEQGEAGSSSSSPPPSPSTQRAYDVPSVEAGRVLEPSFLPGLNPSSFSMTANMLAPFVSVASQRRMVPQLRWVRDVVERALVAALTDCQVLEAASKAWRARLDTSRREGRGKIETSAEGSPPSSSSSSVESPEDEFPPLPLQRKELVEMFDFLAHLGDLQRRKRGQAHALERLLVERLEPRIEALAARHRARQAARRQRFRELEAEEVAQRLALEERKAEIAAARKARAEAQLAAVADEEQTPQEKEEEQEQERGQGEGVVAVAGELGRSS